MPIDFPTSPSSGQRYDYLSKSWIWNDVYWASVGASGNVSSGQLGTPVVFSGNIASGSIGSFHLASGVGGGGASLSSGSVTSGYIGDNAVTSGNIASGQIGQYQINDFNIGTNLSVIRGGQKGYFAGGYSGNYASTADKLTYSTDTTAAQTTANLSQARQYLAGVSEGSTKGYFTGGFTGIYLATTDKITFSNDTTAAQTSANLPQGISELAGCSGTSTKGYFGGGYTNGTITTIYKIDYITESISQLVSTLSQPRRQSTGISEGSTKGYFTGGFSSSTVYNTTDKILYSNDTCSAQTTANLSQARFGLAGCSGEGTKGYFAGGQTGSVQATTDKLVYSTDTTSAQTTANLSQARVSLTGASQGSTKGYIAGGADGLSVLQTTADKITYTTDTTAAQTSANLSQARAYLAGVDNVYSSVFGNNSITSGNIASGQINNYNFSSGVISLSSGQITSGYIGNNAVTSGNIAFGQVGRFKINNFNVGTNLSLAIGGEKGYFVGGNVGGSANRTADLLSYSNDTTIAQTTARIAIGKFGLAGVSDGNKNGYLAGGNTSAGVTVATTEKLTYSNDTTAAQTTANLSQARAGVAGVSQILIKGYFAGGSTSTVGNTIVLTADKLTYSNDTTAAQTTANLSQARDYLIGISDGLNKGYLNGGNTSASSVTVTTADKLTYSTDTTAAQTSANLNAARSNLAGSNGETTKGYFAGGAPQTGSSTVLITAEKLTYSTDATVAQTTANLSQARAGLAGISQGSTKGYFAGGNTNNTSATIVTTAEKITYSNDTTAAQSSANLSQARSNLAAVGQEYSLGVFGDNSINSGNIASGQIGQYHFSSGTTNNATNPVTSILGLTKGYFAGGITTSDNTTVVVTTDKLTYTTDTTTAQSSANLSQARGRLAGCSGDSTKGYFAGGYTGGAFALATADKLTYSSDATVAQTTANLSQARYFSAGVSEGTTKGYFAGGYTGAVVSTADKLTYSTDTTTAQTSANLSQARYTASVDGTSTKGYFAGGVVDQDLDTVVATADKLTYSTDTTTAQTSANLSQARGYLAGVSEESTKSYFAGGSTGAAVATADKLTYSTDTTVAQTTADLSQARYGLAGASERITKGYFAGGSTGSAVATADKLTYSTDTTTAQTTANLSQARNFLAGVGQGGNSFLNPVVNSGTFGDSAVTSGNISSGQISTFHLSDQSVSSGLIGSGIISRFKLSNQSIYSGAIASGQIPVFSLSSGLLISSSFGNESVGSGQILASSAVNSGGKIGSPHIASGEINSFNIASGAVNASSRLGSQSIFNLQSASIAAGASLIFPASIWTTDLAFDSILSGGISSGIIGNTKISDQGVGSGAIASGQVFRFHTSSGFINSGHFGDAALSSGSFNFGCVDGNSLTSGLWAVPYSQFVSGGIIAGYFNNNSINYNAFQYIQSYENAGYFAGGFTGVILTTADKLTYSNDTTVAQTTANLSQERYGLAGCSGDSTKGYFAGGFNNTVLVTTTYTLTYSTATVINQSPANLSQARTDLAGISERSTKGYFAGGSTGASPYVTTADKITYAGDTTAAQTSANLSQARFYLAGVSGDSTKGYFAGGLAGGGYVATADKLTYTNDITTAQTSANLTQARGYLTGCSGDSTKGYFAGGYTGAVTLATADKLTYSTDTTSAQTTANLSQARYSPAGISELSTKGYFAGGNDNTVYVSTADKLTYSTDTTNAQTSANLSQARAYLAGVDGGSSPVFAYNQIVISGKLTTTAANEIRSTNFANNSVLSGNINSNSIFSVIGGYTPFSIRSVRSGAIPSGEIGPSHFARQTLLSGNFSSGLFRLIDLLGDQVRSGNIGDNQINSGHFSSNFIVTSSMVASGQINPSTNFAQTAELNTNFPLSDSFVFQEQCSGIKAVCIASGSRIVRAQRASGLRLPAIGVTSGNVNSGSTGRVFYLGGVGRTGTLAANSGLNNGISGFQGLPLYVGSGGNIVNLSGMLGTSSGAPFLSGNMQQQIGIAISGGIFVMPSPRIVRSGFQGILPYNHPA